MSDDHKMYLLQLQQVEAALTTDPKNEELLKLQKDLQEVIQLTQELETVTAATGGNAVATTGQATSSSSSSAGKNWLSAESGEQLSKTETVDWKIGDKCMAFWEEDGEHYEAVVEELLDDGTCTVTYTGWNNSVICPMSQLRPLEPGLKRGMKGGDRPTDAKKSKKDLQAEQREYKRKKNLKKAQRLKQLEEEHESDKNKWLDFNHKTFSKTSKGKVKKSIFATPESVSGKVGVGTCGSGGRPMTSYQHQEKWKK